MANTDNINQDINTLVRKLLMGELTVKERELLEQKIKADPKLSDEIQQLSERWDLADTYRHYASFDADKAKAKFLARHNMQSSEKRHASIKLNHRSLIIKIIPFAAAAAILALVIINLKPQSSNLKLTTPQIAQEMKQSMQRLNSSKHSGASLILKSGKSIDVESAQTAIAEADKEVEGFFADKSEEATLVTHHDKEFWMTLDDGTLVHLNYNTSLTYPIHFTGSRREVSLNGEAYFIISHADKPFFVHTSQGDIRDYGTEFSISTKDGATEVVLVKGSVGVTSKGGKEQPLSPGCKAVMRAGSPATVTRADLTPVKAWNTGNYYFDGATLEELMEVVSKWYDMDVDFENPEARKVHVTGNLDKYGSIMPTMHAISAITGHQVEVKNNRIIIK